MRAEDAIPERRRHAEVYVAAVRVVDHVMAAHALERAVGPQASRTRPRVRDRVKERLALVDDQHGARKDRNDHEWNEQLRGGDHDRDDRQRVEERRTDENVAIRVMKAVDVRQRRFRPVITPAMNRIFDEREEQPAGEDGDEHRERDAPVCDAVDDQAGSEHEIDGKPDPVVRFAGHQPIEHGSARFKLRTIAAGSSARVVDVLSIRDARAVPSPA